MRRVRLIGLLIVVTVMGLAVGLVGGVKLERMDAGLRHTGDLNSIYIFALTDYEHRSLRPLGGEAERDAWLESGYTSSEMKPFLINGEWEIILPSGRRVVMPYLTNDAGMGAADRPD